MTRTEAAAILDGLDRTSLEVHSGRAFVATALDLALSLGPTVYDALYLALAISRHCPLVTADERFYRAVRSTALAAHVVWVDDVE